MKKLLFLALMSLAAVSASARDARAWFGCFGCCHDRCGCERYTTKLCIRPYNAFSPVAYGNIVADGCMPVNVFGGHGGGYGPQMRGPSCFNGGYGGYGGPGCCFTSGCCDSGCLPPAGSFAGDPQVQMAPGQIPQGMPAPTYSAPAPQPLNQSMYMQPMQNYMGYGYGYNPVQPAGYAQPMYNPYLYQPNYYGAQQQQQAPGYWYGR